MSEYTLTLPDIRAFVASKQPDELVGKPGSRSSCLVACTLAWKYPGVRNIDVSGSNTFVHCRDESGFVSVELPTDVESTADSFDYLKWGDNWITRKQLEEQMPKLFTEGE